jgi:hypothetical protein
VIAAPEAPVTPASDTIESPAAAAPAEAELAIPAESASFDETSSAPVPAAAPAEPEPDPVVPRKRLTRPAPDPEPSLGLELDEPGAAQAPAVERTLTSDGATRLLATAYIGIGNRLYIRGDGAGLSWEKGVPLQFVSIGKWRWETYEAATPLRFKLYKNDDVECSALGEQTLEPGHLQEVTAAF